MKKYLYIFAALSLVIPIYLISGHIVRISASGNKDDNTGGSNAQVVVPVDQRYVAAEGKVEAMPGLEVDVGSEIRGRIEKSYVKEGDSIKKGSVIVRLNSKDIKARLKEAESELIVAKSKYQEAASGSREEEINKAAALFNAASADLDIAGKNLTRHESLYKEGLIAEARFEESENNFKLAKARATAAEQERLLLEKGPKAETLRLLMDSVKKAEATVEYFNAMTEKTVITSPITGKVIHKYLEEGEIVSDEFPLIVTIADVVNVRISAEVDETDIDLIHTGDPVEITSDAYKGKLFKGEIQEIASYVGVRDIRPNNPAKNLDKKVIKVKIKLLEKTPLKLGMTVDVRIKPNIR